MEDHTICTDCPDVDDLALRMARTIDPSLLRDHEAIFVIVVANARETVVKTSPNLPQEKVEGVLRVAAQIARGESSGRAGRRTS